MRYQRTLKKSVSVSGIGLHTGRQINITLRPAVSDTGIFFERVDLPGAPSVKAICDYVSGTRLATTIKRGDASVSTVEHLMAAFALMRVDNALDAQTFSISLLNPGLDKEISEARTFGFLKDVEMLKSKGLALGGSPKNAIVIDENSVMNEEGLRFPDELVRHKVLASLGDLYLMGAPLIGHFVARKGGHALPHRIVTRLLGDSES